MYRAFDKEGKPVGVSHAWQVMAEPIEKRGGWIENETGKIVAGKKPKGTIDMTPTWRGMLPLLLELYENSNATGRQTAISELRRMADAADAYNASLKA